MFENVNGRVIECDHKYVFKKSDSYWRRTARFATEYVVFEEYFCEKCLTQKEVKKCIEIQDGNEHTLPGWARTITFHAKDVDYSW